MNEYIWKHTGFSWVLYYGQVRHFNRMGSLYMWDVESEHDSYNKSREVLVFEPRCEGALFTESDLSEIYSKMKELNEKAKAESSSEEEASDHNEVWGESKI